jgi:CheY-like chemotaxis protein
VDHHHGCLIVSKSARNGNLVPYRNQCYFCTLALVPTLFLLKDSPGAVYRETVQLLAMDGRQHVQAVLVVEEDEVVRGLVCAIVKSGGYEPIESSNGEDAFLITQGGAVDAIVLDCMGRSAHGMETLKRLRADSRTTEIPVIAMCGLGQYGAELGLWAKAVVVKPFRPAQLLMKLQNAIRAQAATASFVDTAVVPVAQAV